MFIENQNNLIGKVEEIKIYINDKNDLLLLDKYFSFIKEMNIIFSDFIFQSKDITFVYEYKEDF